jgi:ribosomal protein L15
MKIKIKNKIYDSEDEPIIVILSKEERRKIEKLRKEELTFCFFPSKPKWKNVNIKKIQEYMKQETEEDKEFFFTFGVGQEHYPGYVKVIAKTEITARNLMVKLYGFKWAYCYSSLEKVHELERRLVETIKE